MEFYFFRKSSIATVTLVPGTGAITVNDKDFVFYMQNNPSCDLIYNCLFIYY